MRSFLRILRTTAYHRRAIIDLSVTVALFLSYAVFSQETQENLPDQQKTETIDNSTTVEDVEPDRKKGILDNISETMQQKASGKRPWFHIYPGINLNRFQMSVQQREAEENRTLAVMRHSPDKIDLQLDAASQGWRINEWLGFDIMIHSQQIYFNRQITEDPDTSESIQINDEGTDLGTRINGYYSYIMPAVEFGGEKTHGFKAGIGLGIGSGWMGGTVHFQDKYSDDLFYSTVQDPTLVGELVDYNYYSGLIDADDMALEELYMVENIEKNGNLELLGQYWIARGVIAPNPEELSNIQKLNPELSLFEIAALQGFTQKRVSVNMYPLYAYKVFVDFPPIWPGIHTRFYVEGPIFDYKDYNFSFQSINLAVYFPIGVGL